MPSRKAVLAFVIFVGVAYLPAAQAAPKAGFVHRPAHPHAGRVTTFDAFRTSCDRNPCTYRWRIAATRRGARRARPVGRGKVLRHTFRRGGTRYVRLTVSNRRGRKSSKTMTVFVRARRGRPGRTVNLREVDGGPGYYSRFSHALPTRPSYFPVGVWFESAEAQAEIKLDKAIGLNLYIGVACPECANEGLIRSSGMRAIIQSSERTRFNGIGPETAGWELLDEIDMTDGPPDGNGFEIIETILNGLPADGRLRYNNYGKGVLLWQDDPWPAQWVNRYQHVLSTDLYWFTDPNQIGMTGPSWLPEHGREMALSEVRRAANYGYQIDRLRDLDARDGQRKPIWALVEAGWPFTESAAEGARAILPAEIRAAVWHSLIAGARGVIYFNHSFGGPEACQTQHVLRNDVGCYARIRGAVKAINHQIRALAPVLNAPNVISGWRASSSVRAMVKWHKGRFYVFAASRQNRSSSGTISIPCVGNATAVRLREGGSVPIRGGAFSDSFADGNAVHIYRIDDRSTCGPARLMRR